MFRSTSAAERRLALCCATLLALPCGGLFSAGAQPFFALEGEAGRVAYEEHVSIDPVDSDWDAAYAGLGGVWSFPLGARAMGRVNGRLWRSGTERETWRSLGQVVQQDDLRVTGFELRAEAGWPWVRKPRTALTPFVGLGFQFQRFERDRFRLFEPEPRSIDEDVREDFDLLDVHAALEGEQQLAGTLYLRARAGAAYVPLYSADNEAFGRIDGGDGYLLEAEAGAEWRLARGQRIFVGATYRLQDLNRNVEERLLRNEEGQLVSGQLELPDNQLEQAALMVRWELPL